jgi:hypothetical protein
VGLLVLAATIYNAFFLYAPQPQMAVYYVPLAAILVARLHVVELARTRAAYAAGVVWLSFLLVAGLGLTLKDMHREAALVRGPGGSIAAAPADAAVYQRAVDLLAGRPAGEPVLVAPLLAGLYAVSGRESPLPQISIVPGAIASAAQQRDSIRRIVASRVRLVLLDRRALPAYGQGAFGTTYDRLLATWIRRYFVRTMTLGKPGLTQSTIDVLMRRS